MKFTLSLLLLVLPTIASYAQIVFEPGYIIGLDEQRKECLIKNIDWKNNPDHFIYKLPGSDKPLKGDLTSVKEFAINHSVKYVNAQIKIDRSSDDLTRIGFDKNPEWSTERIFLKVLLEGEATLFAFSDGSISRYFFSVGNSDPEQLIFKNYRISQSTITQNNHFKQQLLNKVRCGSNPVPETAALQYSQHDLVMYFKKYHECTGKPFVTHTRTRKDYDFFNLRITPGINHSTIRIKENIFAPPKYIFEPEWGYRIGLEAEFILPFHKNKWAVVLEPTFQNYHSETERKKIYLYPKLPYHPIPGWPSSFIFFR